VNDQTSPRLTLRARPAGLGDQLLQHRLAHALAHVLGARYVHTPIPTYRMWPGVGEFTGLDLYPHAAEGERVSVGFGRFIDADGAVIVPDAARAAMNDGVLLEVAHEYLPLPRLRSLVLASQQAPIPFRRLYLQARERRGHIAPKQGRARVVVHLRLGDRAVEQLPDGRLFYRYGAENVIANPGETLRIPAFTEWAALRRVLDEMVAADLDVILLTDGYERYMKFLRMARRQLGLEPEQIEAIGERLSERLNVFAAGATFRMVVGEGEAETRFAIDALADADVVVKSTGTFCTEIAREFGGLSVNRIFKLDALLTDGPGLVQAAIITA
jgi:hypothetical protein